MDRTISQTDRQTPDTRQFTAGETRTIPRYCETPGHDIVFITYLCASTETVALARVGESVAFCV